MQSFGNVKLLVRLRRHKHKSVVFRLPARKNDDSPIPVLGVDVVEIRTRSSLRADNLFGNLFEVGSVARQNERVGHILHRLAVLVLKVAHFVCELSESLFKHGGVRANPFLKEKVALRLAFELVLFERVRRMENGFTVARGKVNACLVEFTLGIGRVCESPRRELGTGLIVRTDKALM